MSFGLDTHSLCANVATTTRRTAIATTSLLLLVVEVRDSLSAAVLHEEILTHVGELGSEDGVTAS